MSARRHRPSDAAGRSRMSFRYELESVKVVIRKRWPSDDTSYCCPRNWTEPIGAVKSRTGSPTSGLAFWGQDDWDRHELAVK